MPKEQKDRYDFLNILYAEDEEITRTSMQRALERSVGRVDAVANGVEGLEKFHQNNYDIVITDIQMPEMDGLEMLQAIKEANPDIPVAIISAFSDSDNLLKAIEIGVDHFIIKPVRSSKIREVLKKTAEKKLDKIEIEHTQKVLREYKKAVDASAILTISDLDGVIIYANDRVCEVSGYSRGELLGNPHSIFRHPEVPKETFEDLWNTIQDGRIWQGIIKNQKKDGSSYYVDSTIVPVLDEFNNIIEYLGLRYEITSLVRKERALHRAIEETKMANRAKSEFLANMSHEIRTPMNGIIGFLDLLKETPLESLQKDYLSIIDSSANHLLGVINDILDLSKIESGQLTLESYPFSITSEIKNIFTLFDAKARSKSIAYALKMDDHLPFISGDAMRLRQVLANLIGNAIKFTPEHGRIEVEARLQRQEDNHATLLFGVKDNGIGIPEEKLKTIFSPFQQADGSVTRKYGGTGLGLSISRQIVQMFRAELKIESTLHIGSRFFFEATFPLADESQIAASQSTQSNRCVFNITALVAEDNTVNQKLIQILLEEAGVKVIMTSDGAEAVEQYTSDVDIVFMDINMSKMDGLQAFKQIRKKETARQIDPVPVVALTANAMEKDSQEYLDTGMSACLIKPFKKEDLLHTLSSFLSCDPREKTAQDNVPSASGIIDKVCQELGINQEIAQMIMKEFFDDTEPKIEILRHQIANNDLTETAKTAHYIKGAAANLRLESLAEMSKKIELGAKAGESLPYGELVEGLEKEFLSLKEVFN